MAVFSRYAILTAGCVPGGLGLQVQHRIQFVGPTERAILKQRQLDEAKKQLEEERKQVERIHARTTLGPAIAQLSRQFEPLQLHLQEIEAQQSNVSTLKLQLDQHKNKMHDIQGQIDSVNAQRRRQFDRCVFNAWNVGASKNLLEQLNTTMENLKEQCQLVKNEIASARIELDGLQRTNDGQNLDHDRTSARLQEIKSLQTLYNQKPAARRVELQSLQALYALHGRDTFFNMFGKCGDTVACPAVLKTVVHDDSVGSGNGYSDASECTEASENKSATNCNPNCKSVSSATAHMTPNMQDAEDVWLQYMWLRICLLRICCLPIGVLKTKSSMWPLLTAHHKIMMLTYQQRQIEILITKQRKIGILEISQISILGVQALMDANAEMESQVENATKSL